LSIYQHFRKHEHPFVDQVLSWKEHVEKTYTNYLTDFLDPREQQIVRLIIGETNEEIKFEFFGGNKQSERQRAMIAPFYEDISEEMFEVTLLEGTFEEKFNQLAHRDILGALMSSGIERKKSGDIHVGQGKFQMIITQELATYLKMNITKINRASIQLIEKPFSALMEKEEQWQKSTQIVSSLRLDVIVKEIYRMSRKDAVQYIKGNKVKVNFTDIDDPSLQVIADDLISVRGYGRSKIVEINGKTRKNKMILTTARLKL